MGMGKEARYLNGEWVDASGSVAEGGTFQPLFPADPMRKRWLVQNPTGASEPLLIAFDGDEANAIEVPIGQMYSEAIGAVSTQAISISAATDPHDFVAKYMTEGEPYDV